MYLTIEESRTVERLELQIESVNRRISKLERDYEKFTYPVISASGSVHRGGGQQILEEIRRAKEEKSRLVDQLNRVRANIAEDRRRINSADRQSQKERAEQLKYEREQGIAFDKAEERWKARGFFYKLTHLNLRPNKIIHELDEWNIDELNSLHRFR